MFNSVLVLEGHLIQLRELLKCSLRGNLTLALTGKRTRGVLSHRFSGVHPTIFFQMFRRYMDAALDETSFAMRRSSRITLTLGELKDTLSGLGHGGGEWYCRSGNFGRHVWLTPWLGHRIQLGFSHSKCIKTLSHATCKKCTFVGAVNGV